VLETLRLLRLEINALIVLISRGPETVPATSALAQRIQSLAVTWSLNFRAPLIAAGVPREVVTRADDAVAALGRLTAVDNPSSRYTEALRFIYLVVAKQILLEVARLPLATTLDPAKSTVQQLLPEISGLTNELIPNALVGFIPGMRSFLKSHIFDRNVFIMIPYTAKLVPLLERVKQALVDLELDPIVAEDHSITDDLNNPTACLLCCSYGVAIFDRAEATQTHNANVVYELAMMQILKRPCIILKHRSLEKMPSNFMSKLYEGYTTPDEAVTKINHWWARRNLA
jgi:hypothetical protein